jgi:hypothetical protein
MKLLAAERIYFTTPGIDSMQLLTFFAKSSRPLNATISFLLIAAVGFLNILFGWELDFSLFNIVPIAFATWPLEDNAATRLADNIQHWYYNV